jgi:hypothetical protein
MDCVTRTLAAFAMLRREGEQVDNSRPQDWILAMPGFDKRIVDEEGKFVLDFVPLRMASKFEVQGRCEPGDADLWGFEITVGDAPFGYLCPIDPGTTILTGVPGRRHSKHVGLVSAMIRLASHVDAEMSAA